MSSALEFKGRDVDEAINCACEALHTSRDQLQIQVLATGSAGIFGLLARKAVVRVSRKGDEGIVVDEPASQVVTESEPQPAGPDDDTPPEAEQSPQPAASQNKHSQPSQHRTGRPEAAPLPAKYHELLCNELATLLTLMDMEAEIMVDEVDDKTRLHISGSCVEQLTSRDGQALDGLQYLLGKMTSKKLPERAMFIVDADDFRQKRLAELRALALRLADEVKQSKANRTIPPLSPADRRIVHITLQDDTAIRSRSVGSGLFKKVLIYKPGSSRRRRKKRRK